MLKHWIVIYNGMIKTPCPLCNKEMNEHNKSQIEKCLWKFVREAKNPVAYASINPIKCPECEKQMLDHTVSEANECVNQFIADAYFLFNSK